MSHDSHSSFGTLENTPVCRGMKDKLPARPHERRPSAPASLADCCTGPERGPTVSFEGREVHGWASLGGVTKGGFTPSARCRAERTLGPCRGSSSSTTCPPPAALSRRAYRRLWRACRPWQRASCRRPRRDNGHQVRRRSLWLRSAPPRRRRRRRRCRLRHRRRRHRRHGRGRHRGCRRRLRGSPTGTRPASSSRASFSSERGHGAWVPSVL